MTRNQIGAVKSLGLLSELVPGNRYAKYREELLALAGRLPLEERAAAAAYLRAGAITFAAMEYTRDVIGDAFGTPGGSAMLTDGTFYWRADCADYVEHYGVALPEEFVSHARAARWTPPELSRERVLEVDNWLYAHLRVLAVIRWAAQYVSADSIREAERLADHGQPAEVMSMLAWSIVNERCAVPPGLIDTIRTESGGVAGDRQLPPDLDKYGSADLPPHQNDA